MRHALLWLLREFARDLRDLFRYGFSHIPPTRKN